MNFDAFDGQTLTLRLAPGERDRLAFMRGQTERLEKWLSEQFGRRLRVRIEPPATPAGAEEPPAQPQRRRGATQQDKDEALRQPLTRQVADLFDARVVDVRRKEER